LFDPLYWGGNGLSTRGGTCYGTAIWAEFLVADKSYFVRNIWMILPNLTSSSALFRLHPFIESGHFCSQPHSHDRTINDIAALFNEDSVHALLRCQGRHSARYLANCMADSAVASPTPNAMSARA
jgi:hypothetical protein